MTFRFIFSFIALILINQDVLARKIYKNTGHNQKMGSLMVGGGETCSPHFITIPYLSNAKITTHMCNGDHHWGEKYLAYTQGIFVSERRCPSIPLSCPNGSSTYTRLCDFEKLSEREQKEELERQCFNMDAIGYEVKKLSPHQTHMIDMLDDTPVSFRDGQVDCFHPACKENSEANTIIQKKIIDPMAIQPEKRPVVQLDCQDASLPAYSRIQGYRENMSDGEKGASKKERCYELSMERRLENYYKDIANKMGPHATDMPKSPMVPLNCADPSLAKEAQILAYDTLSSEEEKAEARELTCYALDRTEKFFQEQKERYARTIF